MALSVIQRPRGYNINPSGIYSGTWLLDIDTSDSYILRDSIDSGHPPLQYVGDAIVSIYYNGVYYHARVNNSVIGNAYFTTVNNGFVDQDFVTVGDPIASYSNNSSIITCKNHSLNIGDIIYIQSNQAVGFWYVTPLSIDTFNIREYAGASVYTFVGNGSFNFLSAASDIGHGWNAVHLPIVYKLKSDLWPANSVDTIRTVSSYSNDNGYVKLTLSGDITSTVTELEFVKVTFTGGISQIYQILTWYSNSVVTINLSYIGGLTFTGVQYYYNNYHARIRIYAGLSSSHFFNSQKPYELITEQKVIPDSYGICTLNINEFLKQQIEILKNDLLKGTLQNNIDAFCQFYITYAEAYDYSIGGYTLLDYIGSYTDDSTNFQGFAVNADLPFKNLHSGYLSNYVFGSKATKLKFLTPSLNPELTPGQFFDISFVNQIGARLRMKREAYSNGTIVNLFFDDINDYGVGIYRYEVSQSEYLEDRIDLTLQWDDYSGWVDISEVKTITVVPACAPYTMNLSWLNSLGGFDYWAFKTNLDYGVTIEDTNTIKKNIFTNWPKSFGESGDTILQETSRQSRQFITVRAENVTMDQINDLFRIRTSPFVQIVNSRTDRRTVIPDAGSFTYLQTREKLFDFQFKITLTDNLPSQSL